jgi:hypothetical protein
MLGAPFQRRIERGYSVEREFEDIASFHELNPSPIHPHII